MKPIYNADGEQFFPAYAPTEDFIASTPLSFNNSAMTIIDGVMYLFPKTPENTNVTTIGHKYKVNGDGTLTNLGATFQSNFGHNNTVDFCPGNRHLLSTNGGNSTSVQPNKIYIMGPYAENSNPASFMVADGLTIDVSQEGWGKQPNAIWANSNCGANDMIYVFTNYESGNMSYYDRANVDEFTGDSKRFLRKLQLGKGSNNLGKGTMRTCGADEFNGTYKIIGYWEYPFVQQEAINDACFYNGKIYTALVKAGINIKELSLSDFNLALNVRDIKIDWYNQSGTAQENENEGIVIYNGILYIGNPQTEIKSFWADLVAIN